MFDEQRLKEFLLDTASKSTLDPELLMGPIRSEDETYAQGLKDGATLLARKLLRGFCNFERQDWA